MRMSRGALPIILVLGFCSIGTQGQTVATWIDTSGVYSSSANWSTCAPAACPAVPTNGGGNFYNAVINGTGTDTITFDDSGAVINGLTLATGETFQDNGHAPTLTIGDATFPAAGSLTNDGTINWGSGSNLILDITAGNGSIANSGAINLTSSTLTLNDSGNGNTATLSGGGTLSLSGGTITGSAGDETLINSNNIIQGSGTISNLTLVNNGTINANGTNPLNLASGGVNNGAIDVTGAGGLVLAGHFENSGTMDVNHSSLTGSYNKNGVNPPASATLTIENGSTASLAVMNTFQNGIGSEFNVVETGSTLTVGTLYNFAVTLEDLSGSVVTIGSVDNTMGILLVDNSTMNLTGYGSDYAGHITVQNGGILNVTGSFDPYGLNDTSITGKSVANFLGTLNNTFDLGFIVDNSVLNVSGDLINNISSATLQNNSIGAIGGSLSNDDSKFTIDQSILTVRGNVDNSDHSTLTLGSGSIANAAGTFTNDLDSIVLMSGTNDVLNVQGLFTNAGSVTVGSLDSLNANGGFTNSGGSVNISSSGILCTPNYSQSSGLTDISGNLIAHSYSQSGGNTTIETTGVLSTTTFTATGELLRSMGCLIPLLSRSMRAPLSRAPAQSLAMLRWVER